MNVHRFAIGQSVKLKGTIGMSLQTGHMFRVTGRMPPRDSSPQYRIRNEEERHGASRRKTISKRSTSVLSSALEVPHRYILAMRAARMLMRQSN